MTASRSFSRMPGPESETRTMASFLRGTKVSSTDPPAGVNFTALSTRLATASRSRSRLPRTVASRLDTTRRVICFSCAIGSYKSPTSVMRSGSATLLGASKRPPCSISAIRKSLVMIVND